MVTPSFHLELELSETKVLADLWKNIQQIYILMNC